MKKNLQNPEKMNRRWFVGTWFCFFFSFFSFLSFFFCFFFLQVFFFQTGSLRFIYKSKTENIVLFSVHFF